MSFLSKKNRFVFAIIPFFIFAACTPIPTSQQNQPSLAENVEDCVGPVYSDIVPSGAIVGESLAGKLDDFNVGLLGNDRILINPNINKEQGDIFPPGRVSSIGIRKEGDTFSFVDVSGYGEQYLVDIIIDKLGDDTCKINNNRLNLRKDESDCIFVSGENLGAGEGNPVVGPAEVGLDLKVSCPDNKFIKSIYHRGSAGLLDFNIHSDDYRVLCCSESIIIK
ncbi:hypothetical protein HYV88_03790 [Candidatus Woesearchaeota archaeon]|nr:hypothetical protein [Candidatus Woesearchaeota archaeon]